MGNTPFNLGVLKRKKCWKHWLEKRTEGGFLPKNAYEQKSMKSLKTCSTQTKEEAVELNREDDIADDDRSEE